MIDAICCLRCLALSDPPTSTKARRAQLVTGRFTAWEVHAAGRTLGVVAGLFDVVTS